MPGRSPRASSACLDHRGHRAGAGEQCTPGSTTPPSAGPAVARDAGRFSGHRDVSGASRRVAHRVRLSILHVLAERIHSPQPSPLWDAEPAHRHAHWASRRATSNVCSLVIVAITNVSGHPLGHRHPRPAAPGHRRQPLTRGAGDRPPMGARRAEWYGAAPRHTAAARPRSGSRYISGITSSQ
jgi:hypothetical protein